MRKFSHEATPQARLTLKSMASIAALGLCGVAAPASAASYIVAETIGSTGHVNGSIVTDGATGTLTNANIISWNLLVQGGGSSITLTNANSSLSVLGTSLTATASALSFNYSNPSNSYIIFQFGGVGGGNPYWCNATNAGLCYQGATAAPVYYNDSTTQVEARSGTEVIASAAAIGAVPEPATWAMMILGFGAVGAGLRHRRSQVIRFKPA